MYTCLGCAYQLSFLVLLLCCTLERFLFFTSSECCFVKSIKCFISIIRNSGAATKKLTPAQKQQIMDEVVKEQISPVEVGKKWSVNSDTIRAWIRKAGLTLPKIYKKMNPGYELFSINTVLI